MLIVFCLISLPSLSNETDPPFLGLSVTRFLVIFAPMRLDLFLIVDTIQSNRNAVLLLVFLHLSLSRVW